MTKDKERPEPTSRQTLVITSGGVGHVEGHGILAYSQLCWSLSLSYFLPSHPIFIFA